MNISNKNKDNLETDDTNPCSVMMNKLNYCRHISVNLPGALFEISQISVFIVIITKSTFFSLIVKKKGVETPLSQESSIIHTPFVTMQLLSLQMKLLKAEDQKADFKCQSLTALFKFKLMKNFKCRFNYSV